MPVDLVGIVGRREIAFSLRTSDPREAKRREAEEIAKLETRWAELRRDRLANVQGANAASPDIPLGQRSLSEREAGERVAWMYAHWLSLHRENPSKQRFWPTDLYRHLWQPPPIRLRRLEGESTTILADFAHRERVLELEAWCRDQAETVLFVRAIETDEASTLRVAKAIAAQVQRASLTLAALARGEPEPVPSTPTSKAPASQPATELTELGEAWWQEVKHTGYATSTYESYMHTIRLLVDFLKHNDAHRVSKGDIIRFKDHRLASKKPNGQSLSATTVENSDLAALKSVFGWAVRNGRLATNPATGVTINKIAKAKLREREFTPEEAKTLLRAASALKRGKELPQTFAAKRWIPWILAFTGARVGEIAQMRRQDLRHEQIEGHPDGVWVLKITPEAGTVKTKQAREVPLHPQLVKLGFPTFVETANCERLFLVPNAKGQIAGSLRALKNRLGEFGRLHVTDPGVSLNHSWRHRFRTVATDAGIGDNIIDAICGWAGLKVLVAAMAASR